MKLYDVQVAALRASAGKRGFGYFMEQGLGKSLTTLADFEDRVAEREATRLVVVCPNSFKSGWVEEVEKHGANVEPHIYNSGGNLNRHFLRKNFNRPPMVVVNYEAIRSSSTQDYLREFIAGRNAMIAFDESIQLKGHDSAQTKAAIALSKEFGYRRILSGKPVTQGPHDLWGQMRSIGQLDGKNFYAFRTMFCKMGGFKGKAVVGAQNEEALAKLIEPHVFRALKEDWTDLPQKSYTVRNYKLSPEMQAKYDDMEEDFVLWLSDEENVSVDAAITKYIKLAQIQAGFIYDEGGTVNWLVPDARNPRLNALLEILDTEVIGKATIPYVHRPVYDSLMRSLAHLNPAWIKGGMSSDEIREQKRRFNEDPDCRVILLQTRASKYGHTLLGEQGIDDLACRTCILYENSYSLDDRSQIEDRIHRHGQRWPCLYIDLVGTDMDHNVIQALQRKEGVYQSIFQNIRNRRQ